MQKDLLLKLAEHLESGKLVADKFDFRVYKRETTKCGTVGCALGECLGLWPDQWEFAKNDVSAFVPILKNDVSYYADPISSAADFFKIFWYQARRLFVPAHDNTKSLEQLPGYTTKERVAARIRYFVEHETLEGSITEKEINTGNE